MKQVSWVVTGLVCVLIGCKKPTDMATPPNQTCQLQSELAVSPGGQQATTHTYNEQGQLVKSNSSVTSLGGARSSSLVYTYSYDGSGHVVTAITQGTIANTSFETTGTYEYSGGRLTKLLSKTSNNVLASTTDSYSYDGAGQLAAYSYSSTDPTYGTESYTFANGQLVSGAITRAGQSLTLTVDNGRITGSASSSGSKSRYSYDAGGYLTRAESFNNAGLLQSYTTYEYSPTPYKKPNRPHNVVPAVNLYGNKELPEARVAVYGADGSLKAETRYQYQVNSQGYITSISYTQNQPGVGNGQSTGSTTYVYGNCQ